MKKIVNKKIKDEKKIKPIKSAEIEVIISSEPEPEIKQDVDLKSNPQVSTSIPKRIMFEGLEVIKILEFGEKFNLCKMSDDTTRHIPVELFNL